MFLANYATIYSDIELLDKTMNSLAQPQVWDLSAECSDQWLQSLRDGVEGELIDCGVVPEPEMGDLRHEILWDVSDWVKDSLTMTARVDDEDVAVIVVWDWPL